MTFIPIHTPRLTLRPLAADDRDEYRRVCDASQAHWSRWAPLPPPGETADEAFDRHLQKAARGAADGTEFRLLGVLADGRIGGFFNLSQVVRGVFQNAYASWAINAEVARQGLATEGVAALLDFAFAPPPHGLGLHRVQANVIPANAASVALARKAGFRYEGLALRYLKIAGAWQDHSMYAKLADEHASRYLLPPPPADGG